MVIVYRSLDFSGRVTVSYVRVLAARSQRENIICLANERKRNKNITFLGSEIIAVVPLSSILASHSVRHIDLLNIDVEGMDAEVLKSHDWSIEPRVIAIEDSHFDPESPLKSSTYQMLHEKGYILAASVVQTLIFRKKI